MDYQVGSLADMISASSSKKKKKSSQTEAGDGGVKIQFQKVEVTPVLSKKKGSKKRKFDEMPRANGIESPNKKIKKMVTWDIDTADSSPVATNKPSLSTGAKKRLEMKGLPKPLKKKKEDRKKLFKPKIPLDPEREKRTIFVGNLCLQTTKKGLRKLFRKFGMIEAVRKRGAPVADPRTPKKVAIIKSEFHPDRTTLHAYVRFETVQAAHNAMEMNGKIFRDHVLRVDVVAGAMRSGIYNPKKAIFIGNIKFTLEEDDLRRVFESCGEIESVRVVRDAKTGMGKGFGFINFVDTESVELALKLDGEELEKRPIRVTRCDAHATPNRELKEKKKADAASGKVQSTKKKFAKKTNEDGTEFKGQEIDGKKASTNKKKKKNRSEQKKKLMLNMLEVNPKHKKKLKKSKKPKVPSE